jgi:hypothetical protein
MRVGWTPVLNVLPVHALSRKARGVALFSAPRLYDQEIWTRAWSAVVLYWWLVFNPLGHWSFSAARTASGSAKPNIGRKVKG